MQASNKSGFVFGIGVRGSPHYFVDLSCSIPRLECFLFANAAGPAETLPQSGRGPSSRRLMAYLATSRSKSPEDRHPDDHDRRDPSSKACNRSEHFRAHTEHESLAYESHDF